MLFWFCGDLEIFKFKLCTVFLLGPNVAWHNNEDGVLWKLFLLSMLLQRRRDADTGRTGKYRGLVIQEQALISCFSQNGLLFDRFPSKILSFWLPAPPCWLSLSSHPLSEASYSALKSLHNVPADSSDVCFLSNLCIWGESFNTPQFVVATISVPTGLYSSSTALDSHVLFLRPFLERFEMKRTRFYPGKTMKWETLYSK